MSIQIYFKEADLSLEDKQYIQNRLEKLVNFIHKISQDFDLKVSIFENTEKQKAKKDNLSKIEITLQIPKTNLFYAVSEGKPLKSSFDEVKDKIKKELINYKKRQFTELRAGQKELKQVIRGYFKK